MNPSHRTGASFPVGEGYNVPQSYNQNLLGQAPAAGLAFPPQTAAPAASVNGGYPTRTVPTRSNPHFPTFGNVIHAGYGRSRVSPPPPPAQCATSAPELHGTVEDALIDWWNREQQRGQQTLQQQPRRRHDQHSYAPVAYVDLGHDGDLQLHASSRGFETLVQTGYNPQRHDYESLPLAGYRRMQSVEFPAQQSPRVQTVLIPQHQGYQNPFQLSYPGVPGSDFPAQQPHQGYEPPPVDPPRVQILQQSTPVQRYDEVLAYQPRHGYGGQPSQQATHAQGYESSTQQYRQDYGFPPATSRSRLVPQQSIPDQGDDLNQPHPEFGGPVQQQSTHAQGYKLPDHQLQKGCGFPPATSRSVSVPQQSTPLQDHDLNQFCQGYGVLVLQQSTRAQAYEVSAYQPHRDNVASSLPPFWGAPSNPQNGQTQGQSTLPPQHYKVAVSQLDDPFTDNGDPDFLSYLTGEQIVESFSAFLKETSTTVDTHPQTPALPTKKRARAEDTESQTRRKRIRLSAAEKQRRKLADMMNTLKQGPSLLHTPVVDAPLAARPTPLSRTVPSNAPTAVFPDTMTLPFRVNALPAARADTMTLSIRPKATPPRPRAEVPVAQPPPASQPTVAPTTIAYVPLEQKIVDNYNQYLWPVTLYCIPPSKSQSQPANIFVRNLLSTHLAAHPNEYIHMSYTTLGWIPPPHDSANNFIVLHNAADPFEFGVRGESSTTFGFFVASPFAYSELNWVTYSPGLKAEVESAVLKGLLQEVTSFWGNVGPARLARFHRAFWLAAKMWDLSTLFGRATPPPPEQGGWVKEEEDGGEGEVEPRLQGPRSSSVGEEEAERAWKEVVEVDTSRQLVATSMVVEYADE